MPARLIGRRVRVMLHASELIVYDGREEVARHERLPTIRRQFGDLAESAAREQVICPGLLAERSGVRCHFSRTFPRLLIANCCPNPSANAATPRWHSHSRSSRPRARAFFVRSASGRPRRPSRSPGRPRPPGPEYRPVP
ncbi:Mu transposase domain-containing protein [Streptosporangium fragile]|uniref:Mu transposase domain-containing protein n=1 Tax=Streptosporangium fragile TaxID=46186 RepID=UPI0031E5AFA8